ncbi:MAG: hypothetical protein Q7T45_16970 [Bradyrhizobium sp.]|uniref:hypothetical protein n=1 Tax=Bradyrhizobium sp. TaxID=376 RepID=UPI00271606F6|nr:hypothetical protein [Bradyrhizobium sp.]MDO8399506.1 hypothetical protein [Bradyrhizobium sp.]
MKLFAGWIISAGLVVAAGTANAQVLAPYEGARSPYRVVSDIGGPYAAMPPEARIPDYRPGYGPRLLPPHEVYTVLRDSGFSPLGIPVRRGLFYTISVIDRGGDDGRLVIDARTGRILRFLPANRMGDNFDAALTTTYGPPGPPSAGALRGEPRPPRAAPKVASRTPGVPVPKPRAGEARPLAAAPPAVQPAQPAAVPPAQQSAAAVPAKPADPQTTGQTTAPAAAPAVEAKPAPQILPTQDMPKAQGLE